MENIKNLKVNKEKVTNFFKKGALFVLIGGLLFLLAGCQENKQMSTNSNAVYDVIDTTDSKLLEEGIEQVLDVPNEEFKLVINYKCQLAKNARWTVTSDKQIFSEMHTSGLPEGYKVYIDNVHTDTTIRSIHPTLDGITQDTMDDKLHGEQMLGFPISDTNSYVNINSIEGQNESFIKGTYYGYLGYYSSTTSTSIVQRRRTEDEYLSHGVFANKIDSVVDLIIEKPDGTITATSVNSALEVSVWPYITYINSEGIEFYRYYFIDKKLNKVYYDDISLDEFKEQIGEKRSYK